MANDGILVVIINIDFQAKKLLIKPNITTRGFVLVNENEELLRKIENMAGNLITKKLNDSHVSFSDLKTTISQDLSSYVYELTGRRPLLLPIILDIKKEVKEKI